VIVFLRGINLGSRNRIAMPALRKELTEGGFGNVRTYLQSGNVVLDTRKSAARVEREVSQVVAAAFGLDILAVARTEAELAAVVKRNPLAAHAKNPKRYVVTFLSGALARETLRTLEAAAARGERVVAAGRELYAWHPEGIARSKLAALTAAKGLGVGATARNWSTVTNMLELATRSRGT
jgi:uncharacterized protein (DUF1697 family)